MGAKFNPWIKISLLQALSLTLIVFTLGACKGSDPASQDPSGPTSLFPSPLDPKAVAAFRASFDKNESAKPRFHVLSQPYVGDQRIGQIFVGCNFDGKSERICLLDTGSGFSSVPAEPTNAVEVKASPWPSPSPLASLSPLPQPLETFTAAGHSFGKIFMTRLSPENYPVDLSSQEISGIIGEDLLRSGGLSLDFKTSEIKFDRIEKPEELPNTFTLSYVPEIELPIHLNDEAVTAVLDTGASFSAVSSSWMDSHPDQFEVVGEIAERNFSGEITQTQVVRAKNLRVGEVDLQSPLFIALDFSRMTWVTSDTQVVLGFNVISQGQWKIDYPTLRWSFKAN